MEKIAVRELAYFVYQSGNLTSSTSFNQKAIDGKYLHQVRQSEYDNDSIKEYYIKHASFLDREICVQILNEKKSGIAKSITNDGALVLKNNDREIELTIGDIL